MQYSFRNLVIKCLFLLTIIPALTLTETKSASATEITALIVTTSGARKDFVSDKVMQTFLQNQLSGLNKTLNSYTRITIRPVGTLVVTSDATMPNSADEIYDRIRAKRRNFAGVLPRRDQVKADIIFVYAGAKEIAGDCFYARNGSFDRYFATSTHIVSRTDMLPKADKAIMVMRTTAVCRNGNTIHRAFGKMMGLLHSRTYYDKLWGTNFYNAIPVKTVFAFLLDPSIPIGDASVNDAMAPSTCTALCGRVYYSGPNVSSKVGLANMTFYKDSKGGYHNATAWLDSAALTAAAFR